MAILINGKESESISIFDRGLCYGDGFFETFYCLNGVLQNWSYHWKRMKKSANILKISMSEQSSFLCDFESLKLKK